MALYDVYDGGSNLDTNCSQFTHLAGGKNKILAKWKVLNCKITWKLIIYLDAMTDGRTWLTPISGSFYLQLRERNDKIKQMTSRSREDKERSITVMLFAVVMTFLLCQTVFYVMAFLEAYKKCAWESTKFYLIPMDLFLITTNSSVNFLIYAVFGSRFREELKIVLRQWTGICLFG